MPKSKDAFRTISEVAEWLDTPAHVLRFWESKFTQVKPVKRAGGRRYYRPADMQLLGGIKKLLHDDGLTIKGAQKLLREHGVKHVADLSQPLEDALLDDVQIEEAAFEANAEPQASADVPATVLSFPNRSEGAAVSEPAAQQDAAPISAAEEAPVETSAASTEGATPASVETASPELPFDTPNETPSAATAPDAAPVETPHMEEVHVSPTPATEAPSVQPKTPAEPAEATPVEPAATAPVEPEQTQENTPTFGSSDELPAFLRRSVAAKDPDVAEESADEPTLDVPEQSTAPVTSAPVTPAEPAKVTINPVAHLEPIETETVQTTPEAAAASATEELPADESQPAAPAQQPIFSRRMDTPAQEPAEAAPQPSVAAAQTGETTQHVEPSAPQAAPEAPKIDVDIPSLAKVAPELDSFTASAGILTAVPAAMQLSPELAASIATQLADLRALRDRMQNQ
ncbi:MerR family transcriptional regulator [Planktotalea sp.]|uniref:MerR family transcriptional regulator n=1 Tax=Planktotalea sp. TaxID=2029877 RepID=UPI003299927E